MTGPRLAGANVVVITVDTLRRDHLAPYGAALETAAASRLAREGVLFERAVSQVPLTLPSHASIFTGLYPPRHGVHDNGGFVLGKDATTLAERLLGAATGRRPSSPPTSSPRDGGSPRATRPTTTPSTTPSSRAATSPTSSGPRGGSWTARSSGCAGAPRRSALLPLGPSLRPARALRAARGVPAPGAHALRRRGDVRRLAGRAAAGRARRAGPAPAHRGRLPLRPRRVAGRPRRVDPRHLPVRRHARRAAHHRAAVRGVARLARPGCRPGGACGARPPRRRHADAPRPRRAARAGRPRRREPPAADGPRGGPRRSGARPTRRRTRSPARSPTPRPTTPASTTAGASSSPWRPERWKSSARRGPSSTTSGPTRRSSRRLRATPRVAATLAAHLEAMNLLKTGEEPKPGEIDPEALERLQALGYVGGGRRRRRRHAPVRRPIRRTSSRCSRSCCRARPCGTPDGSTRPSAGSRSWCARTPTTRRSTSPSPRSTSAARTTGRRSRPRAASVELNPSPRSPCSTSPSPTRRRAASTRRSPASSARSSSTRRTSRPSSTSPRSTTPAASARRPSTSTSARRGRAPARRSCRSTAAASPWS